MDENIKWVEIKDYEGIYTISEYGDIYSFKSKKILRNIINKNNGYIYINLYKNGKATAFRVHKLVARHFIGEPEKEYMSVGHYDNNKQNNHYTNLYWTTVQKNTQKAVTDGLMINKKAENNPQSRYVKVLDKETDEVVGVYGSMRECERCIANITLSTISKVIQRKDYKPRTRKYKYCFATEYEFEKYSHLKNIELIESKPVKKNPILFKMINEKLNYEEIHDNQVTASKICGISQSQISHLIKNNGNLNGWFFIKLKEIERIESSAYQNHLNTISDIKIKNIYTNEELIFSCANDLKRYFNLKGNDFNQYKQKKHLILHEWEIVK